MYIVDCVQNTCEKKPKIIKQENLAINHKNVWLKILYHEVGKYACN